MKKSLKRARILAVAAVSACALMAVTASAASAANAWFVNPGLIKGEGSLTLKQAGGNEKVCTPNGNPGGEAGNLEFGGSKFGAFSLANESITNRTIFWCPTSSSRLELNLFTGTTTYESGFWASFEAPGVSEGSPYGSYNQVALKLPWTNGTEGKQSTIKLSNTKIGSNGGGEITATGTITVKRSSGEVLTLTH